MKNKEPYVDDLYDMMMDRKPETEKRSEHRSNKKTYNPLQALYRVDADAYDRDKVLNILVKKNGLLIMINDIKTFRKSNGKGYRPIYAETAIKDIIFASALPEAIDKVFLVDKLYKDNEFDVTKKDLDYLMDDILRFCNSRNNKLIDKYGYDAVKSMTDAYTNILYKLNKKKIKKFNDIDIPEGVVKKIVVLTAGKEIETSIYQLLKYLYELANNKTCNISKKNLIKIFKACYGKKSMPSVAKYLMLEHVPHYEMSKPMSDVWVLLDEIMRETLESLDKKDIEKILKEFINARRNQEKNRTIRRRLGDRRNIHPDDYKKLTKVFENLENKDFSVISLFR